MGELALEWDYTSDGEDDEKQLEVFGRTAILCIIDCSAEMLEKWEGNENLSPVMAAIRVCTSLARSLIKSSRNDLFGVLLAGVGKKSMNDDYGFENLYVLQKLETVTVSVIQNLLSIWDNFNDNVNNFRREYSTCKEFNMLDVFWKARKMFDEGKANEKFKRNIFLFTCNDDPCFGDAEAKKVVKKKFLDLGSVELSIVSFKLSFDGSFFYKFDLMREVINAYQDLLERQDDRMILHPLNLEELTLSVSLRRKGARPISRLWFEVERDAKISVGVYKFASALRGPQAVNINVRSNEILEKKTNIFRSETGQTILKSEERKELKVGNESVVFDNVELKSWKDTDSGIVLLAFIPKNSINPSLFFKSSGYFIYPDDKNVQGSKELFSVLLRRCVALEKWPIVKIILSRGRSAKIAMLIPSIEEAAEGLPFPQGFLVHILPFSDEIRKYEEVPYTPESTENIDNLMMKLVKKLTNKRYKAPDITNPVVQSRWKQLEVLALEREPFEDEYLEDYTEPDHENMKTRLGNLTEQIEICTEQAVNDNTDRYEEEMAAKNIAKVEEAAMNRNLTSLTVKVMSDYLSRKFGINVRGKNKSFVMEKVYDQLKVKP